jgi:hypothetical protein
MISKRRRAGAVSQCLNQLYSEGAQKFIFLSNINILCTSRSLYSQFIRDLAQDFSGQE